MSEATWNTAPQLVGHGGMMNDAHASGPKSEKPIVLAIGLLLGAYAFAGLLGWPQAATAMITAAHHDDAAATAVHHGEALHGDGPHGEPHGTAHADASHSGKPTPPPIYAVIPFVLLLGAIAAFPLVPGIEHWWESNRNRFMVAAGLGVITLGYYLLIHPYAVERHFLGHDVVSTSEGLNVGVAWTVFQNAILGEYIPFIVLLFSLYSISGGIRITGDLPAHPTTNAAFIGVGGLMASFVGTTGAAMLLIRPLLETNSERHNVRHTVIFFIFVVCNCGGCLLPIGDPPLFLGYLAGVDFLWTMSLWPQWLLVNGLLVGTYFVLDRFYFYPRETAVDVSADESRVRSLKFDGLARNGLLLIGVIFSVALLDPSKTFPGTNWHPWQYLREIVQIGLVGVSLLITTKGIREANKFNFHAILEVAALFFGIFICMQPALQILDVRGASLGFHTPMQFFWVTGFLSSVLDNAPTYLVFFKTAQALPSDGVPLMAGVAVDLLTAISLGAVFMGAMTYIGNGPNFMVKAIAESAGVKMPGFFGYFLWACIFLLPILLVTTLLFL